MILSVPYHLDARLASFDAGLPVDREVTADLPAADGWLRLAALHEQVARAVAEAGDRPLVVSGDCPAALGVLAGLQRSRLGAGTSTRSGASIGLVWFDAHADFHTEESSTSGYLGGMPLAQAAGVGNLTLPTALGLRPVPESRIVLVDARDTDPGEHELLGRAEVRVAGLAGLSDQLPDGDLYLHVDLDVCDPDEVPGLLYPTPAGPSVDELVAAVSEVTATGRVVAVSLGATWDHRGPASPAHRDLVARLAAVAR